MRARDLLLLAACFGLLTGSMEVAARGVQHFILHVPIGVSPQIVWMAPLVDVVFFVWVGALLHGGAMVLRRRVGLRVAVATFTVLLLAGPLLAFPRIHWVAGVLLALGVGVQVARIVGRQPERYGRLGWVVGPVIAAVVAAAGVGMNVAAAVAERRAVARLPVARAELPSVLLVILDTVRAANFGLYGYARTTTPRLDRFAADGLVFDRAMATAPWTLPSHGSFFTGRDAHELATNWRTPLSTRYPTLAEVLRGHGYLTAGFVGNLIYGQREYGLDRGFTRYEDYPVSLDVALASSWLVRYVTGRMQRLLGRPGRLVRKRAATITGDFLRWVEASGAGADRPFFAFLNLMDAHNPYTPPAPFDTAFGADRHPRDLSVHESWTSEQLQASMDAYDATIAYMDAAVGQLLDTLRARGLLERTVVIVTSDHGEHFGEQGLLYHANSLYTPLLHVPLVVAGPGVPSGRLERPVSLADLPATVLALTGAARPAGVPGHSWLDSVGGGRPIFAEVRQTINMAEWFPASRGDMLSIVSGQWHYIESADGSQELFDLNLDPREAGERLTGPQAAERMSALRSVLAQAWNGTVR